jgi:hypothetical protein
MEDPGGFERLVNDVLATMRREGVIKAATPAKVLVSAHSGGYRPAAYVLKHGGLRDRITDVFLFDAFYGEQDSYREWLLGSRGTLRACYTGHLRDEHVAFEQAYAAAAPGRLRFVPTTVDHDLVVQEFFAPWLRELDAAWKTTGSGN